MTEEKEVEKWVTVNGKHVPIYKDKVAKKKSCKSNTNKSWKDYDNTQENRTKLKKQIDDYTSTHKNPTDEDRKLVSEMRSKYKSMVKESMDKAKAESRAFLAKYNEKSKLQEQLDKANKEYYTLYKHDEDNIPGRNAKLNSLEKEIKELEQKLKRKDK